MDFVYAELARLQKAGQKCALAVLVESKGSTPQKAGAKAIFLPDGRVLGTLGGGCLEAETQRKALRALDTGENEIFDAVLDDDFGWDDGLICGGSVRIFIQPNPPPLPEFPARQRSNLITDLMTGQRQLLPAAMPVMKLAGTNFHEPVIPNPALIICGAGHTGLALARLAGPCGFTITVIDDRVTVANRVNFPEPIQLLVDDPASAIRRQAIDADTYLALVTRGHRHDAQILREIIHSPAAYIGMIGSKRKLRIVMETFIKEGIATAEDFRRVHSPMGVPIGSITVEEIAISIMAELIAIRRGTQPPSLSATAQLIEQRAR